MYFGIYSITNLITGDMYIGQTIQDFEVRWKAHKRALKNNCHDNEYLQRSWNKYGEDAFEFKAIHYCDELDNLNELEKYYIKKYDTFHNGFNMTEGGDYFLNEIPEEIQKKKLENLKKAMIEKSDYTEHQIAKVKEMLSDLENNPISIKKISKLTGVREKVVYNVKNLNSWIDVRSDLNEKIKTIKVKELRNENIVKDLYSKKYLLDEICKKYKLSQDTIKRIFKENNAKDFSLIFKEVNDLRNKEKFLNGKQIGITTHVEMEKHMGCCRQTYEKMCERQEIDYSFLRNSKKAPNASLYKSDIKGINYDNSRKNWYLRITFNGKQIPIGHFKTEKEAIDVKKQLIPYIENNDYNSILKIKALYTKEGTPKKFIKAINLEDNSEEIIEGIGVCARKLDIPRKSIERVLQGKQLTAYGYTFSYM